MHVYISCLMVHVKVKWKVYKQSNYDATTLITILITDISLKMFHYITKS